MSILRSQLLHGKIHARTSGFLRRLAELGRSIDVAIRLAKNPYVSCSFGKQSVCMAHEVHRIAPAVPMYFFAGPHTWDMHDFRDVIDKFQKINPNAEIKIVESELRLKEAAPKFCPRDVFDLVFMGLAKEESKKRLYTLLNHIPEDKFIYRYVDGSYRCCPLANWKTDDIAAYVAMYDLPLLDTYHRFGLEARTTARPNETGINQGVMNDIRITNSKGYRAMLEREPDLENK